MAGDDEGSEGREMDTRCRGALGDPGARDDEIRVSGQILRCLLTYVHQAVGDDGVASVEAATGIGAEALEPGFDERWCSTRELLDVAAAAERVCGDPDIGRRAGETSFRLHPEAYPHLIGTGSPRAAMRTAVAFSNRSRTARGFEIVDSDDDRAVVVVGTVQQPSRFGCAMSLGFWSMIPSLFGAVGTATEPRCVTRGDDRCEFRISWTEPTISPERIERGRRSSEMMITGYEQLNALAAELSAQDSVQALVRLVAARAAASVRAPSAVVLLRLGDGDPLTLGWHGTSESDAHEVSLAHEMGLYDDDPAAAVAEIRSPRRLYGHVVVFNQPDTPFGDADRRMLQAFANFATATIETAAALQSARIERDAAESMLELARVLAEVASTEQIAQRIAEAVPTVVRCSRASVLRWDEVDRTMTLLGAWPDPGDVTAHEPIQVDRTTAARRLVETARPVVLVAGEATGYERAIVEEIGAQEVVAAPIVVREQLLGMVTAVIGADQALDDPSGPLRRLQGLADHAATALDNSRLLDAVQHQALHDPLTGLPNRTLAEDRVRHALMLAERTDRWVTLLFVDLDDFKAVNDELGHAAGDELLRQVADRLRACIRASDTVSRLGGDEFLVLLENTAGDEDGQRVAAKIMASVREPFVVGGRIARVSASVGITSAPGRGTDYDELLSRADDAMYQVKRGGRDGWAVYAG